MATFNVGGGIDHSNASIDQYQVTFPTGVTCSSFNILITDDEFSEGDENFTFTIMEESLPYGVILGDNTTASVIINDNDSELLICIACLMGIFCINGRFACKMVKSL